MYLSPRINTLKTLHVNKILCLFSLFIFAFSASSAVAQEISNPVISMFDNDTFQKEKRKFSVYEKMYVVLDFPFLSKGNHAISADWITPWGNLNRQDVHRFSLAENSNNYRVYFWLKLKRKSALQRTLTGSDFTDEYFGEWQVRLFLDGEVLEKQQFTVN